MGIHSPSRVIVALRNEKGSYNLMLLLPVA